VTTHDLRDKQWSFVPQSDPDGRTTLIHIPMASNYQGDIAGQCVIVGSGYQARYRILSADFDRSILICEYAPRTLAEIDADAAAVQASRPKVIQPMPIPIPVWVPAEFHFKYRNIARLYGEEAAANAARHRKKMIERAARFASRPSSRAIAAPREVERV
jgi:hypothetical protein